MVFKHQLVRDLAYIMQAPLIYQDVDIHAFWQADLEQALLRLDQDPKSLEQAVASCKSHFLGSYFEVLFSYAINYFSRFEVIFEHQQLITPQRTLGEVDALVRSDTGQIFQFEVAIKFYLESDKEPGHWIGPNKNDSFIKKYTRAKTHQLLILAKEEAQPLLRQYQITAAIQSHLLMFGMLFKHVAKPDDLKQGPVEFEKQEKINLEKINQLALRGYWLKEDNLAWLQSGFLYAQELDKPHWLSDPIEQEVNSNTYGCFDVWQDNIRSQFSVDERPRQFLICCQKAEADKRYLRLFVVPSRW